MTQLRGEITDEQLQWFLGRVKALAEVAQREIDDETKKIPRPYTLWHGSIEHEQMIQRVIKIKQDFHTRVQALVKESQSRL